MKARVFVIPGALCSLFGLGLVMMAGSSPSKAGAVPSALSKNAIRIEFVDTGSYSYGGNGKGIKLERMTDSQTGVVCYRREPAANYDCVKL